MRVVAYFKSVPALDRAAREADRTGWRVVSACSPAFNETLLEAAHATRSPVASAALVGGIAGLVMGLVLTVGTVRQWPGLIVGGKPLVSMPPFLIIMFELTILVAAVAAAWSFLSSAARARRDARGACDATTTDNRFSLLLEGAGADPRRLGEVLTRLDACEWRRIDV